MKTGHLSAFIAALFCASVVSLIGAPNSAPTFPTSGFIEFKASVVEEKLENHRIDRLQLSGPKTIIGELIPGLSFKSGQQNGPFVYRSPHYPDTHASLYAFPAEQFAPKINPETLNAYLARKQLDAPETERFEIIEEAERNTGAAKFRFLGGKAYTLTYDYEKVDSLQQNKRFRCTENWRLHKGIFYVFVVEAPVQGFAKHYRLVAGSATNMHFAN